MDYAFSTATFPNGTRVFANALDGDGEPVSAVVSAGEVTFVGLREATEYVVHAYVAGAFKQDYFRSPADSVLMGSGGLAIRPTLDEVALKLRPSSGGTSDTLQVLNDSGAVKAGFKSTGAFYETGDALFGNATASDFASDPNIPHHVRQYFGSGYASLSGRPQAVVAWAKYLGATPDDSAQGGSAGAIMRHLLQADADAGTITQTKPITGNEGDALVQGRVSTSGLVVGVAAKAQLQNLFGFSATSTGKVIGFYAANAAARDAGCTITSAYGFYAEGRDGGAGTITNKWGLYSVDRIQTEGNLIAGVSGAGAGDNRLYVMQEASKVAVVIVKAASGSADILSIRNDSNQDRILVNQDAQLILKLGGTAHSGGSATGPMIALGNLTTPPSANYSGGVGGFLYCEAGALKWRGGAGTVTTLGAA